MDLIGKKTVPYYINLEFENTNNLFLLNQSNREYAPGPGV